MDHQRNDMREDLLVPEADPVSAFALFFEIEYERVFGAAYLATGSRRRADDLAERAFLVTWDRWDRVREMERPSLFPIRVVMNPLRMGIRGRVLAIRGRFHGDRELEPFEDCSIDAGMRAALLAMGARRRAALALTRSLDLTPGEAGRALGMRADRVRRETDEATTTVLAHLGDAAPSGHTELGPAASGEPYGSPDAGEPIQLALDTVRGVASPRERAYQRHLRRRERAAGRRRAGTIAVVVAFAAIVGLAIRSQPDAGQTRGADTASPAPSAPPFPAGTYRLPGLLFDARVELPSGWHVGDTIWGSDGAGFAAVASGPRGASVSVAVFDLVGLSPVDPDTGFVRVQTAAGRERWYEGFERGFGRAARGRLRSFAGADPRRWEPAAPLAWVLARVPTEPIRVFEPLVAGRRGFSATFIHRGSSSALFSVNGDSLITLLPDVTYSFWAPAPGEPLAGDVLVGIAREPGTTPGTEKWGVIRSLTVRPY
jgi:DNA-directed RNA polymerase specialized sigma24 family protein